MFLTHFYMIRDFKKEVRSEEGSHFDKWYKHAFMFVWFDGTYHQMGTAWFS